MNFLNSRSSSFYRAYARSRGTRVENDFHFKRLKFILGDETQTQAGHKYRVQTQGDGRL